MKILKPTDNGWIIASKHWSTYHKKYIYNPVTEEITDFEIAKETLKNMLNYDRWLDSIGICWCDICQLNYWDGL